MGIIRHISTSKGLPQMQKPLLEHSGNYANLGLSSLDAAEWMHVARRSE
jgi:hypothetical protein